LIGDEAIRRLARNWREDGLFPALNRYDWRVKTTTRYHEINGLALAVPLGGFVASAMLASPKKATQ
jgi:hypothetical protein